MNSDIKKGIVALGVLGTILALGNEPTPSEIGKIEPTYFAELNENNEVVRVIVANQSFIDSGAVGDPTRWVQTSMDKDGAGKGYKYDRQKRTFAPTKSLIATST